MKTKLAITASSLALLAIAATVKVSDMVTKPTLSDSDLIMTANTGTNNNITFKMLASNVVVRAINQGLVTNLDTPIINAGELYLTNGLTGDLFGTNTLTDTPGNGTNWTVNLAGAVYQLISATNNINFLHATNSGAVSVLIMPNGADRTISVPTNWVALTTNGIAKDAANAIYKIVVTNTWGGMVMSIGNWGRDTATSGTQSNVVFSIARQKNAQL